MLEYKQAMIDRQNRYAGICTPGAADCTAFRSKRSDDYALNSKAAHSNPPDAQLSGIFMQHPG